MVNLVIFFRSVPIILHKVRLRVAAACECGSPAGGARAPSLHLPWNLRDSYHVVEIGPGVERRILDEGLSRGGLQVCNTVEGEACHIPVLGTLAASETLAGCRKYE